MKHLSEGEKDRSILRYKNRGNREDGECGNITQKENSRFRDWDEKCKFDTYRRVKERNDERDREREIKTQREREKCWQKYF